MTRKMTHMINATCIAVCLALGACTSPQISDTRNEQGMSAVTRTGMDSVHIDPSVDFASYRSVVIDNLGFDKLQIVQPTQSGTSRGKFVLTEKDMQSFRKAYRDRVADALQSKDGYTIVEPAAARQPGTLRLVTELVRLAPKAPREQDRTGYASSRSSTFSKGAGSMTLESRLLDATTGKTVATMVDKVSDPEIWRENNSVTNVQAVRRGFGTWAAALRRQLDTFSKAPQ